MPGRRTVTRQGREAWTYSRVTDETGDSTPALAVGGPVPTGSASYQLYYLFPLSQEEQTLALVQRTMQLNVTDEQWERWLARYATARGLASWAGLARSVRRKAVAIARHDRRLRAAQPTRNVSIPGG